MKIVFYFFDQKVVWPDTPENRKTLDANNVTYTIE
jgi:hypothetical protein